MDTKELTGQAIMHWPLSFFPSAAASLATVSGQHFDAYSRRFH